MASVPGNGGFLDSLGGIFSNPNNAGLMGAAMGLLQSSGASRLPVTMGAALGNALGQSQNFQNQAQAVQQAKLNNAMTRLMLGYKGSLLNLMNGTAAPPTGTPAASTQESQGPSSSGSASPEQSVLLGDPSQMLTPKLPDTQVSAGIGRDTTGGLGASLANMAPMERMALSAAMFTNPASVLPILFAGPIARARSMSALQNVRQGGSVYDPLTGSTPFYSPHLGEGQVLGQNGMVSLAPGYLQSAAQAAMAQNLARNATTPGAPGINALGAAYPRTVASSLGQPVTAAGIVARATGTPMPVGVPVQGRSPVPMVAPTIPAQAPQQSALQTLPGVQTLSGGVPAPTRAGLPGSGAPTSLGAPTTEALTVAMKSSTQSLQDAIAGGVEQQMALGSLAEMNTSLNQMATGPGVEFRIALEKVAAGIGGITGNKAPEFKDLTNSQVLAKTTTQFAEQAVGANNQNAVRALDVVAHMVPSIQNTVIANQINAGTLTATAAYRAAEAKFGQSWAQTYNGVGMDPKNGRWDGVWQQKAPFMSFLLNQLPPSAVHEMFKYASHNKTLAMQIKQAQAAVPWLMHYGYIPGGGNGP